MSISKSMNIFDLILCFILSIQMAAVDLKSSTTRPEREPAYDLESKYRVDLSRIIIGRFSSDETRLYSLVDNANPPVKGYRRVELVHLVSGKNWKMTNWNHSFLGINFNLNLSPDSRFFNRDDVLVIKFSDYQNSKFSVGCSFKYPNFYSSPFKVYSLQELGCELKPLDAY
ncbi:MAG: hypothetical protein J0M15_05640 [Deltaproteobacteria bacterium]|nr:hypothetical protein [Deltaproteobacteria bacterium]